MDELKFKYDVMRFTEDRCEVKRFKRKPFLEMLSDPFTVIAYWMFLFVILMMLMTFLFLHLLNAPDKKYVISLLPSFLFSMVVQIKWAYQKHKNMTILTGDIKKIYVNKSGKIMKIKFMNSYGYMGVRTIDLPDNEHERQYLINQLNEKNLFVTDKRKLSKIYDTQAI
jgi:hypothetical protein